jgi:hypothetical protein
MDNPNKLIPNNLCVTLRKTAYKGKKYHSGTICAGVTKGLALIKLSGCPNQSGITKMIKNIPINTKIRPKTSFNKEKGVNGIKSERLIKPVGLLDPYSCKNAT